MATIFNWIGMDRLIGNTTPARLGLVTKLNSFKQDFNQLFASKLQHKTTSFTIAPAANAKHLPMPARINRGKFTLWVQGSAGRFNQSNIGDSAGIATPGLDGSSYQTSVGSDYAVSSNFKAGLTVGYGYNQDKTRINKDKGSVTSSRMGVYGLWQPNQSWYINGAVYYGYHRLKGQRTMTVLPAVATQKHRGHHISGIIEAGRDITLPQSVILTPYVSGGAVTMREGRYTEKGADNQNLTVQGHHSKTLQGKGGLQLAKFWTLETGTPIYSFGQLGATYRYALRKRQKITAALAGQEGQFTLTFKKRHRLLFNPTIGVTAFLPQDISATLLYEGEIGSTQRNHQAMVRFNWQF